MIGNSQRLQGYRSYGVRRAISSTPSKVTGLRRLQRSLSDKFQRYSPSFDIIIIIIIIILEVDIKGCEVAKVSGFHRAISTHITCHYCTNRATLCSSMSPHPRQLPELQLYQSGRENKCQTFGKLKYYNHRKGTKYKTSDIIVKFVHNSCDKTFQCSQELRWNFSIYAGTFPFAKLRWLGSTPMHILGDDCFLQLLLFPFGNI